MTDPRASEDQADDAVTDGGLPQEDVADRPNIAPVRPEDYPEADRAKGG
ncbi:hypothetical protein [Sphingomonas glacialis]|nr:hypothetical protein [Sphingomonas glacialis]